MRTFVRWLVRAVVALLALVVLAFAVMGVRVQYLRTRTHVVPAVSVTVPSDSAAIARGKHLAVIFDCQGCHGADLAGTTIFEAGPVGRVHAPNITRGGLTKDFSPADWNRAIRHGVTPSGRALFVMPADLYWHLSDSDVGALIAYARSLPASDKPSPGCTLRPLGWLLATLQPSGFIPADQIDHAAPYPPAPAIGVTAAYGSYLANSCIGCHQKDLAGGSTGEPGAPPAPNLTRGEGGNLAHWTQEQFVHTLRTGQTPEGKVLSRYMPWPNFGQMTDDELAALWMFLQSVPPKPSRKS